MRVKYVAMTLTNHIESQRKSILNRRLKALRIQMDNDTKKDILEVSKGIEDKILWIHETIRGVMARQDLVESEE